jgi:hypothetical protein
MKTEIFSKFQASKLQPLFTIATVNLYLLDRSS